MSERVNVSILLAVRNGATTLDRALRSVANQTYRDFEIIIIDDGSIDTTPAILQTWVKKFGAGRCQVIRTTASVGQTRALNLGLTRCRGLFIARLDADDWWTSDKLEKQVAWLTQNSEYGLVGSVWVNHRGSRRTKMQPPLSDTAIRRRVWWRNPFGHSCVVIRRELLQKVNGYDESIRFGQDLDLWFRLLPHTKVTNLPETLCHRTVTANETKQRQQMRQTIATLRHYLSRYRPTPLAWGGLVEPWLLLQSWWLLPALILVLFGMLQFFNLGYGTKINDLPYIANATVNRGVLATLEQQLQREVLVSQEQRKIEPSIRDQGLLRFKLYSINADEMVNIMALSRINPAARAFDPHFYMYGGAYLYPLGAWYALLVKLGILASPSLPQLLMNPDGVDMLYIAGRFFILVSVLLSGSVLHRTARLFIPPLPATLMLITYLFLPMTILQSVTLTPHWFGLLPATLALYYTLKFFKTRQWNWPSEVAIGVALGWAVGSAATYAPFALLLWLALAYAARRHTLPARTLITIPIVAVGIFLVTNPYVVLNYAAWHAENSELNAWYDTSFTLPALRLFIRNSFLPSFGAAGAAALMLAAWTALRGKTAALRILSWGAIAIVLMAATVTASVSYWHTNTRFIPYLAPLIALWLAWRLPTRALALIAALTILHAAPHFVALADENDPRHSTRLLAAAWVNEHIKPADSICAHLVPYDTTPFNFPEYTLNIDTCRFIIRVEREQPIPALPEAKLVQRFSPRFQNQFIPLVTNHVNPTISIYENLAAN